jgi:hypothetical protein
VAVHDYRSIEFQSEVLYMEASTIQHGVLTYENTQPFLTKHCTVLLAATVPTKEVKQSRYRRGVAQRVPGS